MPNSPSKPVTIEQLTQFVEHMRTAIVRVEYAIQIMTDKHIASISMKSATAFGRGISDILSFSRRIDSAIEEESLKQLTGQPTRYEVNADRYRKYGVKRASATAKKKTPKK